MWFLGLGLSCFGAVLGPQTISVSQFFLHILAYILGVLMQEIIPGPGNTRYGFKTPDSAFWRFMNPGPFNLKEHVAITIFASTAAGSALAISIFAVDDLYYNIQPNAGVGIFTLIGIMRAFLVYPTYMVYPNLLPTVQLFDALHRGKKIFLEKKRVRFFWSCFIGIFIWEWFPEFIAPTLTGVSIFCLAKRDSPWFTRIFGGAAGNEGLGVFALCFDWNYVGSGGLSSNPISPLSHISRRSNVIYLPSQGAYLHVRLFPSHPLLIYCRPVLTRAHHVSIAFCAAYANNVWKGQNFPWLSQELFYENGTQYDQLAILDGNFRLDPAALAVQYGKDIIEVIKRYRAGDAYDPHLAKMKVYAVEGSLGSLVASPHHTVYAPTDLIFYNAEVPMCPEQPTLQFRWYILVFIGSLAMAMATIYTGGSGMPWFIIGSQLISFLNDFRWGLVVGIIISAVFLPFVTTAYAITGFNTSMQNLVQIIGASIMPGSPQTNMYFTLYGFNTLQQSLALVQDLKMGVSIPDSEDIAVQNMGPSNTPSFRRP
ncbi:OPT oligopeptide transporter protein-domain-containing protein [Mycena albidolilacea]|uniref:OPT oligopeptide transporter protein-domain-containing protein n=1 Tax=Mycena albidolilacea TaxID=1033008 RepID=A0AAD6Z9E7_9AGAR|nr:OPT oligopeptide transporter protein-domain-containing protein [Mycena albidolilacea]